VVFGVVGVCIVVPLGRWLLYYVRYHVVRVDATP